MNKYIRAWELVNDRLPRTNEEIMLIRNVIREMKEVAYIWNTYQIDDKPFDLIKRLKRIGIEIGVEE